MPSHFRGPVRNAYAGNLAAREWYQRLPLGKGPEVVEYYNDFLFAGDYAAADWVVTETTAGATQAIEADILHGALKLLTEANDDDVNQLQSAEEWFRLVSGKRAWFKAKVKLSDATQTDMFIGFATTDTTIIAGTTDSIGFRKLDGSAAVSALTEDNTSETATASVVTMADDTYVDFGFYWDGVSSVLFFVNDAKVATHTANIEQTNKLALTLTLQNGEAAAKSLHIDYLYVALER